MPERSSDAWEEACARSQLWADRARRQAEHRRALRRTRWLLLVAVLLTLFNLAINLINWLH